MEPANGPPGKRPERPESREPIEPGKVPLPRDEESPLPEPPQEDGLVRFLRRVPMYAFILFLGVVAADYLFPGVKVEVHNRGSGTMKNVAISVRNQTTQLEPISEGKDGSARFRLYGDANIYVAYTDENGKTMHIDAGEHRFTAMSGTIRVSVKKGKADVVQRK
jgi:hypothetical protein